ncbi:MAG: hypothetical protein H5T61_00505 [Thermoflexales bacterium]|nr:hypothetical protein [Thermoflexales bacterium]
MGKSPFEKALKLPQTDETWQGTVRMMRVWITPPDRAPYRPYIIMFVDQKNDKFLGMHTLEARPTPEQVLDTLVGVMTRPAPGAGRPRRPLRLLIDDAELAQALAPRLSELGIQCQFYPVPLADRILHDLEVHLTGREPVPGLLRIPGVTPHIVEGIYKAAAFFYQEAPWRWISDAYPIEIRYPPDGSPRFTVVMGYGGMTYGLAAYDSMDHLRMLYSGASLEQVQGLLSSVSLVFNPKTRISFDDLEDIARYGWPVAGESAYPLILRLTPQGVLTLPSRDDLFWLEAALLAVPRFVRDYMLANRGEPRPARVTLTVRTQGGPTDIYLQYSASDYTSFPDLSWILNPPRRPRKKR